VNVDLLGRGLPRRALLAGLLLLALLLAGYAQTPRAAHAWLASAALLPNGSAAGNGSAGTVSGPPASVGIALNGARPNTVYAVYSCIPMFPGTFDCVGRNNPPALQQVTVFPQAIAPVSVTLAQADTFTTDPNGNASHSSPLQAALYPDTPASIYNVVQIIDVNDPSDSYTAVMIQAPTRPVVGGASAVPQVGIGLALGVPVYVLAAYPGYAFPVGFIAAPGAPFVPTFTLPFGAIGGAPLLYQQGLCPNGAPPTAINGGNGQIFFSC
jgi:hypothetical protein